MEGIEGRSSRADVTFHPPTPFGAEQATNPQQRCRGITTADTPERETLAETITTNTKQTSNDLVDICTDITEYPPLQPYIIFQDGWYVKRRLVLFFFFYLYELHWLSTRSPFLNVTALFLCLLLCLTKPLYSSASNDSFPNSIVACMRNSMRSSIRCQRSLRNRNSRRQCPSELLLW